MSETATNTVPPSRPPRPWYRLHLSTYVFLVLLAALLVVLMVPGTVPNPVYDGLVPRSLSGNTPFLYDYKVEHGWPFAYLRRELSGPLPLVGTSPPWLDPTAWVFSGTHTEVFPRSLAIDVSVGLLILIFAGAAFEWRRRQRPNVFQFRLWELLVAFAVVAAVMGWWQTHERRFQRELRAVDEIDYMYGLRQDEPVSVADFPDRIHSYSHSSSHSWHTEYCGPRWLRKLVPVAYLKVFRTVRSASLRLLIQQTRGGKLTMKRDLGPLRQQLDCLSNLERLDLSVELDLWLRDGQLSHLAGLEALESLCIRRTAVAEGDLEALAGLTSLKELDLSSIEVEDEDLQYLARLDRLSRLYLRQTPVTSRGVRHLAGLANLQELVLSKTQIDDEGLRHLAGLENLTILNLADTSITDAGLVHLGRLSSLAELDLSGTRVTMEGLQHLAHLERLKRLMLPRIRVSDTGLAHLRKLRSLESLYIVWAFALSENDENRLREAVPPNCDIPGAGLLRRMYPQFVPGPPATARRGNPRPSAKGRPASGSAVGP